MLFLNGTAITNISLFIKNFSPEAVIIQKQETAEFINSCFTPLSMGDEVYARIFVVYSGASAPRYPVKSIINYITFYERIGRYCYGQKEYLTYTEKSEVIEKMKNDKRLAEMFEDISENVETTALSEDERCRLLCLLFTVYILTGKTPEDCPISAKNAEKAFIISEKASRKEKFNAEEKEFIKSVIYGKDNSVEKNSAENTFDEKIEDGAENKPKKSFDAVNKKAERQIVATEDSSVKINEICVLEEDEKKLSGAKDVVYRLQLSENPVFGADDEIELKRIIAGSSQLGASLPVKLEIYTKNKEKPEYITLQTGEYIYLSCLKNKMYYVHPLVSETKTNIVERHGNKIFWNNDKELQELKFDVPIVGVSAEENNNGFVFVTPYGACYNYYSSGDTLSGFLMQEDVIEIDFVGHEMYILDKYGDVYDSTCNLVSRKKYIKLTDYFLQGDF